MFKLWYEGWVAMFWDDTLTLRGRLGYALFWGLVGMLLPVFYVAVAFNKTVDLLKGRA